MKIASSLLGALTGALLSPVVLLLFYDKVGIIPATNMALHNTLFFDLLSSSPFLSPALYISMFVGVLNVQWFNINSDNRKGTLNVLLGLCFGGYCLWSMAEVFSSERALDGLLFSRLFIYLPLLLGVLSLLIVALFNRSGFPPTNEERCVALCCLGTLGGAVLLQLSMWGALIFMQPITSLFPWYQAGSTIHYQPTFVSLISHVSPTSTMMGAVLGLCSTLLCSCERSPLSRVLSVAVALGIAAFTANILRPFLVPAFWNSERVEFLYIVLYLTPPLIWSLILFFAAIRFKSRLSLVTSALHLELDLAN